MVGGTGACPLVARAGFVPLVIRAIPRGVLRGSSTFRKTLGSLWCLLSWNQHSETQDSFGFVP